MADFRCATFFSMRSNADYFQLNILMAGDYVRGRKKEITTWHDLETLLIAIKEVGGMAVFVPAMMSGEMDNSRGILALKDYVDQGQGWGFLKIDTFVPRGYHTRKLLFSNLEVYQPHPQRHIFELVGVISEVRSPHENATAE